MKLIIRLIVDGLNWIAVAVLLALLFPFWLLDRLEQIAKWARR